MKRKQSSISSFYIPKNTVPSVDKNSQKGHLTKCPFCYNFFTLECIVDHCELCQKIASSKTTPENNAFDLMIKSAHESRPVVWYYSLKLSSDGRLIPVFSMKKEVELVQI